jgi:hypothetical protein
MHALRLLTICVIAVHSTADFVYRADIRIIQSGILRETGKSVLVSSSFVAEYLWHLDSFFSFTDRRTPYGSPARDALT